MGESLAQSMTGTVAPANRDFADVVSGPQSKIFAGTDIDVDIVGGQADINFVHRERRECTWYGRCWYDRWIDHRFYAPNEWPEGIEYRFINEDNPSEMSDVVVLNSQNKRIRAPLTSPGRYGASYRLQARVRGDIDPNRTRGTYELRVNVDTAFRHDNFVKYLNNGGFSPVAADLAPMLQLDVWTRQQHREGLVRSLINYASIVFPTISPDKLKTEEHFKVLEVAKLIDPNSTVLSRALATYYVDQGDYASAGLQIKEGIKRKEEQLKSDQSNTTVQNLRSLRIDLATDYAHLGGLAEREGSLASSADYERVDSIFVRAADHARGANARDLLARVLTSRAKILRKSRTLEALERSGVSFQAARALLGRPISGTLLHTTMNGSHALMADSDPSRGVVFEKIDSLADEAALEGQQLPYPAVRTNKGLTPLDIGSDGSVLVDDGGVLSWMSLSDPGNVDLRTVENVHFTEAHVYRDGVLGRVRDATGASTLQYLHGSEGPRPVLTADLLTLGGPDQWLMAASRGANHAAIALRGSSATQKFHTFELSENSPSAVLSWGLERPDSEVTHIALSDAGDQIAFIIRDTAGQAELFVGNIDGSNLRSVYATSNDPNGLALGQAAGLVFEADGGSLLSVAGNKLLYVDLLNPAAQAVLTPINLTSTSAKVINGTFGLDNSGSLVVGVIDEGRGNGFLFRLAYDQSTGEFELNPERLKIANMILAEHVPIFLESRGDIYVGLSRPSQNKVSVVQLTNGTVVGRRELPVDAGARLLEGASYIVYSDAMANSVVVTTVSSEAEPLLISAKEDLKGIPLGINERAKLRPVVLSGLARDEWLLAWTERISGNVRYISRYVGPSKQGETFEFSVRQYSELIDTLIPVASQVSVGPTDLQPGFRLSLIGGIHSGSQPLPVVSFSSQLSRGSYRSQLDAANANAPLQIPVFDLSTWPPAPVNIIAKPTTQVQAFSRSTGVSIGVEATGANDMRYVLLRGDGSDQPIAASSMLQADEVAESPLIVIPGPLTTDGNLQGTSLISLVRTAQGTHSVRHANVTADGTILNCASCGSYSASIGSPYSLFSAAGDVRTDADWTLLKGFASSSEAWGVLSGPSVIMLDKKSGTILDEVPLGVPYSLFSSKAHLVISPEKMGLLYSPLQDPN
ncbi:hypothetical protein [Paracoccus haeundaensis]|uniref:Uncharacterized protein n=1 Tax=Paracoccus haeundaensis TaxID=225362 RepID=A0A5C4RAF8_9RHOB|nr:hypothetical protein [Paracoccus haeundaensis]TNH40946.1 hypothetical protein FHD67_02685 [Paracoccus haeundaensis]